MAGNETVDRVQSRHGRLRRSHTAKNILFGLLTALVVVVVSATSVAAYTLFGLTQELRSFDRGQDEQNDDLLAIGTGFEPIDGELAILLVGSDTRQGQSYDDGEAGELNDVNLLLYVSADHENATIISFPRDTMLPIPSCPGPDGEPNYYSAMSEQQLNSAIMYGGAPCVAETIENLTGLEIPYVSLVTFDGVIGVSNAIGGVTVCLTQPIVDPKTDLDLPAGDVTLVGNEALQFLRTRHGVGDGGDKSRISNQQVFMSALIRELRSADTLTNPVKVYSLAKAGVQNLQLSSNMATLGFMQALAATVQDIDLSRINFVQYPTFRHPYQSGRLIPDYASGEVLIEALRSGAAIEVAGVGTGVDDPDAVEGGEGEIPGDETGSGDPGSGDPGSGDPGSGETGDPGAEGDDGKVVLPENITGQSAANETCSAGRTSF